MTEGIKTLIYVGVALVISTAAFFSRPKIEQFNEDEYIGKFLFEKFDDPAKAGAMEVVQYDDELGTIKTFKIARDKKSGAWTIPSHGGYPADAENRMRDAALLLVELEVLDVPSKESGNHRMYGVVEPDKDKLKVGDQGVGLLLSFEDEKGQDLAGLIIGKKIKGRDDLRFVRVAGQDAVYVVKIDPEQLSTKFVDWIEKDLLKMSSWDVKNVTVKSYTLPQVSLTERGIDPKFDVSAKYESNKWELEELKDYRNGRPEVVTLAENEELNGDKLNDLKNAVDQLEIIDVHRKPKGLGADLKAGEGFAQDKEGSADLNRRGFYVVPAGGGQYDVLSANGELYVGMDEGYEYVLRFGDAQATSSAADTDQEGENRYLLVTARVDMAKFPPPELEVLPELPKKDATGEAASEEAPAKAEGEPAAADAAPAAEGEAAADDAPSADEEKEGDDAASDDQAAGDDLEAKEAEIQKEIERINKENQRKIDERNEKLDKAKEKVADLNIRFADWYYVVSEEQFKKVQLNREDLIKEKKSDDSTSDTPADTDQPEEPGDDVSAFRQLQEEGLKPGDEE